MNNPWWVWVAVGGIAVIVIYLKMIGFTIG